MSSVNVAIAAIFSRFYINVISFYVKKHLKQTVCSILFIHSLLFNEICIVNGEFCFAITPLLLTPLYIAVSKECLTNLDKLFLDGWNQR